MSPSRFRKGQGGTAYSQCLSVTNYSFSAENIVGTSNLATKTFDRFMPSSSSQLFPQNSDVSPFLTERLQDFFLGGMDDMTLWVADRWHVTADLLEFGSE